MTRGQRLRQARIGARREVDELAAASGLPAATLLAWEADIESPSAEQLARLATELGVDVSALDAPAPPGGAQGICRAVDLTPDPSQAETLEQVGLPARLWRDPDTWVAFLRLADAAAKLSDEQLSLLAHNAETCVSRGAGPLPHSDAR